MKTLILIMAIFVSAQASANAQVFTQIVKSTIASPRIQKRATQQFLDRQIIDIVDNFAGILLKVDFHKTLGVKNLELTMLSLKDYKKGAASEWKIQIKHVDSLVEGFKRADIDRLIEDFFKSKGLKWTLIKFPNNIIEKHIDSGMLKYSFSSSTNDSVINIRLINVSSQDAYQTIITELLQKISTKYLNFSNSAAALL